MSNKKLVIHETDPEGCGYFGVLGEGSNFRFYNFEETGDILTAVRNLINVGFINRDDVLFLKDKDIYNYLKEKEEDLIFLFFNLSSIDKYY